MNDIFNQIDMSFLVMESSLSLFETELEEQEERMAYANESSYDSYNEDNIFGFNLFEDIADESVSYEPAMEGILQTIWDAICNAFKSIGDFFKNLFSRASKEKDELIEAKNENGNPSNSSHRAENYTEIAKELNPIYAIFIPVLINNSKIIMNALKSQANEIWNAMKRSKEMMAELNKKELTEEQKMQSFLDTSDNSKKTNGGEMHAAALAKYQTISDTAENRKSLVKDIENANKIFNKEKKKIANKYEHFNATARSIMYSLKDDTIKKMLEEMDILLKVSSDQGKYCNDMLKTADHVRGGIHISKNGREYAAAGKYVYKYIQAYMQMTQDLNKISAIAFGVFSPNPSTE